MRLAFTLPPLDEVRVTTLPPQGPLLHRLLHNPALRRPGVRGHASRRTPIDPSQT